MNLNSIKTEQLFYTEIHTKLIQQLTNLNSCSSLIQIFNNLNSQFQNILSHPNKYHVEIEFQQVKAALLNAKINLKTSLLNGKPVHELVEQLQKSVYDAQQHFLGDSDVFQLKNSQLKGQFAESGTFIETDHDFLSDIVKSQLLKIKNQEEETANHMRQSRFVEDFYDL
ncbi:hypothetical protein SS50377_24443 [Spironucleus salmonicida]|uniref:Uncharacterized protein n=1 Tax=Spironucleus salmonicida TaxID=348837 RepID=V6LP43_9EUKA|nr:hypothetical protein SS50377_24443 [Spironucleus salmonicida]|eukprot:EST46008.1 Hypothetical protein SS50377_13994 [Spironucleus salmonicida]